ncbi:EAL domain-containing protein [Paracidovorax citrulli]
MEDIRFETTGQPPDKAIGSTVDWGIAVLEQLFNSIPNPVLVKDRAHRWLLLNDALCSLLGRSREALLGLTDRDVFPADEADRYWAIDEEVFQSGAAREAVQQMVAANGEVRTLRIHKRLVPLPGREPDQVLVASAIDITDSLRAEKALHESEAERRHALELDPQIPWVARADGRVFEVGPRWGELTGMSMIPGGELDWQARVHPEDLPGVLAHWAECLRTGAPADHEYRVLLADGSYHWFRARAAARLDEQGSPVRWYGTLEDVEDRKRTEMALRESDAFARSILENSTNSISVLDLNGTVLYMNAAAVRVLGADAHSVIGRRWPDLLPAQSRPNCESAISAARSGRSSAFTVRRPLGDGTVQWLDTVVSAIPGGDGAPARILASSIDATDARQARAAAERARREAAELAARLSAVLESTTDSVFVVDRDWRLTYFNGNAARAMATRQPALGRSLWDLFPEERDGLSGHHYRRAVEQQVAVTFEQYIPVLDVWLEMHAYPSENGLSVFFRDITERREAEQERRAAQEKIAHMARHDALTGVPNRLLLRERLEQVVQECHQGARAAILLLDLDGFKPVNDTFGHPAGDRILQQAAERLRGCVGPDDMVARFGGDEFVVVQPRIGASYEAGRLARRIIRALSEPFFLDSQPVQIGTSVGVALAPGDGGGADDLLRAADIALYRAKAEGPGVHRFFQHDMDEHLRARLDTKRALHQGLANGEFELVYQPLFRLQTGEISCFEALLRWRHPVRGLISPADFIPLAEETGLIVQLGEWALQEACRQAATWPQGIEVAVNLSPAQFKGSTLVESVGRALRVSGLQPSRLQLEITETVLLQQDRSNLAVLRALRERGIRIAMDDFGTGYSSLSYLRSFPFDKIKLDRSFVQDLHERGEARAILHAVKGLGTAFRVKTVAEGIETVEQLAVVRDEGYDEGQGYLLSRPLDAAQAAALIARPLGDWPPQPA